MSLTQEDVDFVRELVYRHSAIVLSADKGYLVDARLTSVAKANGSPSVTHLVERLRTDRLSGLELRAVEALTTNETSFFRDIHPFETLRTQVIPEIMQRRANVRQLNIWSAASSSGQEIYTIAMMLRMEFPLLAAWQVRLIATDLSVAMVERTRAGRFGQLEVNRGLPPRYFKFFAREGAEWRIDERTRAMVESFPMNLAGPWPSTLPKMDVVFLRNVLIYFDTDTKRTILRRVRDILRPDGFLFLGGVESTMNLEDGFVRIPELKADCYRIRRI